ncbi:myb family transcription factor EFM-like [Rutidosis leptorrhynchoides]|uniref:myb family transcription factor EFM-like n=1 Tax=Rutidosis leptorrhynchoides TaxID=125765 RepID=UPI003A9A13A0
MGKLIAPHELSLNFKPIFIPKTISQFLGEITKLDNVSEKIYKIDDFISRLETEISKIDAFKRELPLCMLLMNDAIVSLKEELMVCKKSKNNHVLEEFLPMRKPYDDHDDEDDPKVESDKKNWLSSTQLWNTIDNDLGTNRISKPKSMEQVIQKRTEEKRYDMIGDSFYEKISFPELSLITPGINTLSRRNVFDKQNVASKNDPVPYSLPDVRSDIQIGNPKLQQSQQQTSRKQRRCWSTELHRHFVNALQQLGGSKVATPKQIRELMNVDGLTNDEVKSHLQKYRLHTKRNPSGTDSGGFWTQPNNQYAEKHLNSQSGSPDGPLMNCAAGATFNTGDDSIDDGDDEKSENNCWKGHIHISSKD